LPLALTLIGNRVPKRADEGAEFILVVDAFPTSAANCAV
jgi:hypothetical protein